MGLLMQGLLGVLFLSIFLLCSADVHHYEFFVEEAKFRKLGHTKTMLVVNGSYPGPEIRVHRGDKVFVNVHNKGNYGLTIHWHGVKQPGNPWSDGPEFVTQCLILPEKNFTYEVILSDEIGTLWWHAHSDWTRGSVHGAFVILPAKDEAYPFRKPDGEHKIILESWYKEDYKQMIEHALEVGTGPADPEAYAMNGHMGDNTGFTDDTLYHMTVKHRKKYLLRIINAAMNEMKFFSIANHKLTVVSQDASYIQPFTSDYILISPGQTMDVLLSANQMIVRGPFGRRKMGKFYIAMKRFSDNNFPPQEDKITRGVLLNIIIKISSSISFNLCG